MKPHDTIIDNVERFLGRRSKAVTLLLLLSLLCIGGYFLVQQRRDSSPSAEELQLPLPLKPPLPNARTGRLARRGADKRIDQIYEDGFLMWRVHEEYLADWTQLFSGEVRWNAASGAGGEPARGMPVKLLQVNYQTKTLNRIAETQTDEQGRFTFRAPMGIEIRFAAMVERATNVPQRVQQELAKREKPATDKTGDGQK